MPRPELIEVSFFIPDIPPLPNSVSKAHWKDAAKNKKQWTQLVREAAEIAKKAEKLVGLYDYATVHFTISVGREGRVDPDNLMWAVAKPALDGLQGVFLVDDSIDHIQLGFSFNREKPRGFRITLSGN